MNTSSNKNDLHSLFHYSTSFYYVMVDDSGKLEYSNPFFRAQFGKKESGFLDKKLAAFFPDHQARELYDTFQRCTESPGIAKHIDLVILANPENRHISRWEFTAIANEAGGIIDIYGVGYALEKNDHLVEQEINKQKLLTQATIDGQEKERLEMGKELHDNINQHLNTTRLYLEVAREKATGPVKEMIEFSHRSLAGIIDKIRALSQSLVPPTLGDIGLVESIQDICDSIKRTHKFKIHFFFRHFNEDGVPENMRLMLFRITQEQVNNIICHSDASNIQVKLESDAEYINLSIADNGKGFDSANIKKGLGFTNIMNRASLFNGLVEIDTAKGKGCRLSVNIPLKPSHEK